jgi:hypothetical protein
MEQNDGLFEAVITFADVLTDFYSSFPHRWSRRGWNGPCQFIYCSIPDKHAVPFVYINTTNGDRVPWVPSQGDLFACDWYKV